MPAEAATDTGLAHPPLAKRPAPPLVGTNATRPSALEASSPATLQRAPSRPLRPESDTTTEGKDRKEPQQRPLRKTRLSSWPRRYDQHDEPPTASAIATAKHPSNGTTSSIINQNRSRSLNLKMPSSNKAVNGNGNHFPQKLKNFFRINSFSSNGDKNDKASHDGPHASSSSGGGGGGSGGLKAESKSSFRQSKFFTTVGRLRSTTVASEGHGGLDEALSPTAHANPYFAHQGQPGLRHHNDGSVPPSPPDTPQLKLNGAGSPTAAERATIATKEELARKLRRVASAPNTQGLFSKGKGSGERPATAELGKEPIIVNKNSSTVGLVDSKASADAGAGGLGVPDKDGLGALPLPRTPLAFRRTYSSNSIKVRNVEVGPESFDKIKLIGKGDVGKVYLVREKKSTRLYAMKGMCPFYPTNLAHAANP